MVNHAKKNVRPDTDENQPNTTAPVELQFMYASTTPTAPDAANAMYAPPTKQPVRPRQHGQHEALLRQPAQHARRDVDGRAAHRHHARHHHRVEQVGQRADAPAPSIASTKADPRALLPPSRTPPRTGGRASSASRRRRSATSACAPPVAGCGAGAAPRRPPRRPFRCRRWRRLR